MRALWIGFATAGCVTARVPEDHTVSAVGVENIEVQVGRGDIGLSKGTGDSFKIFAESFAFAPKRDEAVARLTGNELEIEVVEATLEVTGFSAFRQGGWDLDVLVPTPTINTTVTTQNGAVAIADLIGTHRITADTITATHVEGSGVFIANEGGMDLSLVPYDNTITRIVSTGDVVLRLPRFLPYDITVVGDLGALIQITDLGFDFIDLFDGAAAAARFPATTRIEIEVTAGGLTLLEL
jgi:hypothetical protein